MVAPDTWSAPASGGTVSGTSASFHNVYHAGDYWFSIARTASTTVRLRYATTPSGAWSTATLPSLPGGVTLAVPVDSGGMQYDGTNYAFALSMGTASRIYYATTPGGTWTEHDFGAASGYAPNAILHDGSRWIMAGGLTSTSYPVPPWIGYTSAGSAVTSTWTFGTSTAATGYDVADLGGSGTRFWEITALESDGTTYVAAATRLPTSGVNGHLRYCTDVTAASWGTPTTTQIETTAQLRYSADADHWISMGPNPTPYYTQDPTSTWSVLGTATTLNRQELLGIDYGNGYWVAGGVRLDAGNDRPSLTYLEASSPGSATYTSLGSAAMGFPYNDTVTVYDAAYYGGYFVAAASTDAELRYCSLLTATAPTYLRQRQSAVRAPSRVTGIDLRARQTAIITK